jgi:dTMP kinase
MKFLVIEGLDGSGKSTQVAMLRKYLDDSCIRYKYIHFPRTEAPFFGELVAMFLRGELGEINQVHPKLVAMIYAGDRLDAARQIREWIAYGSLVLIDRYAYSNIAYQCAKLKDKPEREKLANWIRDLEFNYFGIPKPDLSIYLNTPFDFVSKNLTGQRMGEDRNYLGGTRDIHEEDLQFQQQVHEVYLWQTLLDPGFIKLDCQSQDGNILSAELIFDKILDLCKKHTII